MTRVAFQGEFGANSEAAALKHFGAQVETVPSENFDVLFDRVVTGDTQYAMVPIENTLAGSIYQNYDLLARHDLHIVGEEILRVEHFLIAAPGVTFEDIRTVISQQPALAQCEHYVRKHGWAREAAYDTAGSVKLLKASGRRDAAAIAPRRAAQVYDMNILVENIEDDTQNYTRFLVLAREPIEPTEPWKTSIVFTLRNMPGALFKALSVFALRDIDLTKIESRPIPGSPWEYTFYLDFGESAFQERGKRALSHLAEITTNLRVLGSYPRAQFSNGSSAAAKENAWKLNLPG